ncbi:hypothetical protein ACHQM5_017590 [Ranunculus cassubicifolius]
MSTQPDTTIKRKFVDIDIRSYFSKPIPNSESNNDPTISTTLSNEPSSVQPQEGVTIFVDQEVNPQEDAPQGVNHEVEEPHEVYIQEDSPQEVDHQDNTPQEAHPQEDNLQEDDHEEENPEEVYPQEDDPLEVDLEDFDIDTIERDPGLRRQIWEYPVNKRKEVREAYLKMGPYHWKPIVGEYPLTKSGKQNRKFNSHLFEKYPWLEYSPAKDKVYCLPCFLFESSHPQYPAFTTEGFNSWKRIGTKKTCSLRQHVGGITSQHMLAVSSCEDLMTASSHIDKFMAVSQV